MRPPIQLSIVTLGQTRVWIKLMSAAVRNAVLRERGDEILQNRYRPLRELP